MWANIICRRLGRTDNFFSTVAELSMGPFSVTRSNPTHQLTDTTQPNLLQVDKFGPNPYFYTQNAWPISYFGQPITNSFIKFTRFVPVK